MKKKVALVTGASSGIGKETAIKLRSKGFKVYGAARRTENMKTKEYKGITAIYLDVTNEESMVSCVKRIIKKEGRIDILINNAGYGSYGAVEDVSIEEARHQLDVNLFGLARMTQLVIPHMRKNHFGKIVNMSSMGGKMCSPFGGWYHATKYAVEAISDCLRMEVSRFGIDVIIIEPGIINTKWDNIAINNLNKTSKNGPYEAQAAIVADYMTKIYSGNNSTNPKIVAKTIVKAITAKKPKTRYLVGSGAKLYIFLKTILSDRCIDKITKKIIR